jgi:predicted molibdopterin-dependent oxidoreductase YjgC
VDVCPTGALTERAIKYEPLPEGSNNTICPFCSNGCEMVVMLSGDRILNVKPSEQGVVNKGQACVKGRFLIKDVVYSSLRVLHPMIRRRKELEEVSWEEALDFVAQKISSFKANEIGFIHSSQLGCEDHFIAEKVAREVMKTKNVATTTGFSPLDSLSHLAQKNGIKPSFHFQKEDIAQAEAIFLTGTELAITHPILWLEVLRAVRQGAKLVVASPFEQVGNRHASLSLPIKQGSEDLLFQCLSKVVLKEGDASGHDLEGFPSFKRTLDKLNLSTASEEIGIDEQSLYQAAEVLIRGQACFIAGIELTQFSQENRNMAALWNLSLLCKGQLIPLGLENNNRGIFELKRNDSRKTRLLPQIIQDTCEGRIKALYVIGSVPLEKTMKAEFLVMQDSYMSEVAERADAVLPATTFAESDGTVVNVEGRIQRFLKVIQPLGEAKPDWWILSQLAKKLRKKDFDYKKSQDILKELKKTVPAFAKISPTNLKQGKTPFVETREKGKKKFLPLKSQHQTPKTDKKFPFILWTDYSLDYYRNLVFSREIKGFKTVRNSQWIRLNPKDAKSLKLKDGEIIILESPGRKIKGVAKITEAVPDGTVRASFLWNDGPENSSSPLPVKVKRGK